MFGNEALAGFGRYRAKAVSFDGTNDYLERVGAMSGTGTSKVGTFSGWFRLPSAPAAYPIVLHLEKWAMVGSRRGMAATCVSQAAALTVCIADCRMLFKPTS